MMGGGKVLPYRFHFSLVQFIVIVKIIDDYF